MAQQKSIAHQALDTKIILKIVGLALCMWFVDIKKNVENSNAITFNNFFLKKLKESLRHKSVYTDNPTWYALAF